MTKRRSRGDGGLHWDETRQRWIASVTVGYTPAGKRIVRKASGKTKTEAHAALRAKTREYEDGLCLAQTGYIVAQAVEDWLTYGLNGRSARTVDKNRYLCKHIIAGLGARKLCDLTTTDVDRWLLQLAKHLSSSTLQRVYECLNRTVIRAMACDKVNRNVVALCGVPTDRPVRPPVQVAHSRRRQGALERSRGLPALRLCRVVAAHRSAHRRTSCSHLGARRP
jgi:hypothetical protein